MRVKNDEERGAIAIMTAVSVVLLVGLASFAVDLGYQRVAARDMQAVADTVAMDMARQLDGGTSSEVLANGTWNGALKDSLARNQGDTVGDKLAPVECGFESLTTDKAQICATPGIYDPESDDEPFLAAEGEPATHVRVITRTRVDYFFPVYGDGGWVTKTAYAEAGASVCYSVGSFALGLAKTDSLLRRILGPAASARVLSSSGLANVSVSLLRVATEIGAVTPHGLLAAPNITIGDFLDAAVEVLQTSGDTASVGLVSQVIGLKSDLGPLAMERVDFGRLLDFGQGNASALDAKINVLDIVSGAIIAANKVNGLSVPEFQVVVPGATEVRAKLTLSQPPVVGCNGGVATSAEGHISLRLKLGGNCILLGLCTTVTVDVSLANASAKPADEWTCNGENLVLRVDDQTLANVRLTADVTLKVLLAVLNVAHVDTGLPTTKAGGDYELPLPDSYVPPGVGTHSGSIGLDLSGSSIVLLPDARGNGVDIGIVTQLLDPVVSSVSDVLTRKILPSMGLTTAGADLRAVPEIRCNSPRLRG